MKSILSVVALLHVTLVHLCGGFYVPIATTSSVRRVARSIELADSTTVVVARNSTGHVVAFHDYCPHRGASFNNVRLGENSDISCPYHDFRFSTKDGKLQSGIGVKSGCASLKMIDCVERNGLVWACVGGDTSLGPPPALVQASDPKFRKLSGSQTVQCPAEGLVCNVLCSIHLQIHSFGNRMEPEPMRYLARKVSPTCGLATFQYNAGSQSMFSGVLDVCNWYNTPCTAGTLVRSGRDVKIVQVHAVELPNGRTKVFWELYRNWATQPWMDGIFRMAMKKTLNEDKDILERCSFDGGGKFHGRYDKLQVMYRRSLEKVKLTI